MEGKVGKFKKKIGFFNYERIFIYLRAALNY